MISKKKCAEAEDLLVFSLSPASGNLSSLPYGSVVDIKFNVFHP